MKASALISCFMLIIPYTIYGQTVAERAEKLYEDRKYAEAKKILEPIDDNHKEYGDAQYYLGRIAFDERKFDEASDFFEKAVDQNEKVAEYQNWLGNAYAEVAQEANVFKQGMLAPKMKGAWEKAVSLSPSYLDPRESLIQFYLKAPGIMGGSVDKAKETANQILTLDPAKGHLQFGNIYVYEKKFAEAEKEYVEMVKVNPSLGFRLANFYVSQKQYDKAFSLFEESVKTNPDDMIALYQIGKTSAISGLKTERGEECLKKYLAYTPKPPEPSHAGANMRLGQIVEKRGDKAGAKKYFETALKLDGSLKEAAEGLQRTSK